MINLLKEKWQIIADAFFNHPTVFLLSIASIFACVALAVLTFYIVGRFEVLKYPFLLFTMVLMTGFYIDVLIWIIKFIK